MTESFSSAADLFARWMEKRAGGESSAFETFVAAHPEVASELHELREDWEILARLRSSPSFAERLRARHGASVDPEIVLEDEAPDALASELVGRLAGRTGSHGRYRLKGEVARGGQGAVVLVWDEDLRRNLAMKIMLGRTESGVATPPTTVPPIAVPPVDARSLGRFLEEAQVTGQLDHPGIVPVHELGLDAEGRVYFTMKLVRGEDLRAVLTKLRAGLDGWTRTRVLGVLLKACEALAYAHAKGVVHRDLKPGNVMVGRFGEVYVMDWGLARVRGRKDEKDLRIDAAEATVVGGSRTEHVGTPDSPLVTRDGDVIGTPSYMAPEQALGRQDEVGPHSDVYAVGALLYDLLAGRMPYEEPGQRRSGHEIWARVRSGPPDPIHALAPDAPAELLAICEKAMAREVRERYPDMGALAEDLRAFLEHRVVAAYRTGALVELEKWIRRNRSLAGAIAAGALALAAGLVVSLVLKAESDHNARLAEERRLSAEENQHLAETRRDDVLRLSALQDLDDLLAGAEELWPALPDRIGDFERWIERARELTANLPVYRTKRDELRARALPATDEEREAERRSHPAYREFHQTEGRIAGLRAALARRRDKTEAELPSVDWSHYPSDPDRVAALAWERVKPDRRVFGEEPLGLVLARRALEGQPGDPDVAYALAHAYLALGRDDEALEACYQAVEIASAARKKEFEDLLAEMERTVARASSPEGVKESEQELAKLEIRRAELDAVLGERREWRFPEAERQARWWNNQLSKLIDGLAALERGLLAEEASTPEHGWSVPKRLAFARELAAKSAAGGEYARAWDTALPAIRAAYRARSPDQDLALEPELGLVPIGADPASGLWEFAHVATGEVPARDAEGKLVLTEGTALVLVLLPGGTFTMGDQARDPAQPNYTLGAMPDEGPPHEVTLSPFFLSKFEMTQGQWLRFTGRNPSTVGPHNYGSNWNRAGRKADLLHPVESVSWNDCTRVLPRLGLTLPSEAQWEYGARAGTTSAWWTGDAPESLRGAANIADRYAREHGSPTWNTVEDWLDDGNTCHAPIGSYAANAFGLYDVIGNLWEWCLDGYDEWFYGRCGEFDPVCDPNEFQFAVNRGGSFEEAAATARAALRNRTEREGAGFAFGVRPARALVQGKGSAK
jgi:formylglycine-generating enzyme required for sulfatase activity/serine/threonine protein kinase